MYDMDDIDRARRAAFERDWALQHNIAVEDLERLGYVACPLLDESDERPQWQMMTLGPCIAELTLQIGVLKIEKLEQP